MRARARGEGLSAPFLRPGREKERETEREREKPRHASFTSVGTLPVWSLCVILAGVWQQAVCNQYRGAFFSYSRAFLRQDCRGAS